MDCIFCKIVKSEIKSEIILESENFIVIKDVHPKTKGHSLVLPKEHYESFLDIPKNFYKEMMKTTKEATGMLLKENSAMAFNLVVNNGSSAGQIINHAHLHILPRKENDGFRVSV